LLDTVGQEDAADATLAIGILGALPTALAGAVDWTETGGSARRTGLVHGLLNTAALGCFVGSLAARRSDRRRLGLLLSATGLSIASVSAWLGGDLVYRLGTGVSRDAWLPPVTDFQRVMQLADLPEGKLTGAELDVGGEKQRVLLLRSGGELLATSATCTHEGGPLDEGQLVGGDCVVCPWHGSEFDLRSGGVRHGPATAPVPTFEVRVQNGAIEVRSRA
ncbi:MAG: Rieske 2Fe-2S domain-containing protein, partial [Chloroflexi bacterium]|nr:Rieske 2Fe-2S domain-containing protein [Chloroflexota bacterium]